jgi:three-Cys-motif partner protein
VPLKFEHHTKIKLRLLRYYLTICGKVHAKDPQKFTYFETHAGDGTAEFPDVKDHGSALIAASSPTRFRCVLMEANTQAAERLKSQIAGLQDSSHVLVLHGDCNRKIRDILDNIPPHFHSLGFVDPTHPGELRWETVAAIAGHAYRYYGTGQVRVPEILLNFPVNRIKRNAGWIEKAETPRGRTALRHNDEFFGTGEWRDLWTSGDGDALLDLYVGRLMKFGFKDAMLTRVDVIENNVPIYYLILCVWQSKAQEVLPGMQRSLERWRREEYIRDYYKVHDITQWVK